MDIYIARKTSNYIINRKMYACLEIPPLFLVLNMILNPFAALTRRISCSKFEINLIFQASVYYVQVIYQYLQQQYEHFSGLNNREINDCL